MENTQNIDNIENRTIVNSNDVNRIVDVKIDITDTLVCHCFASDLSNSETVQMFAKLLKHIEQFNNSTNRLVEKYTGLCATNDAHKTEVVTSKRGHNKRQFRKYSPTEIKEYFKVSAGKKNAERRALVKQMFGITCTANNLNQWESNRKRSM